MKIFVFCLLFCCSLLGEPKIALVTGASTGIGRALVHALLDQGYEVIALSRALEKLEKIKEERQSDLLTILTCDVTNLENIKEVTHHLIKKDKIPSLFFLNAGLAGFAAMEPTETLDLKIHERIFAVNYYGVLHFVEEWLKPCQENGGATFVVSSSVNAYFAPPGGSAYAASKAAISKAFDGLQLAHMKSQLKFLSVFCGPVDTRGLAVKLPFTWTSEKMAHYMIQKAEKKRAHSNPSWFYSTLGHILNMLPEKQVMWILELFKTA